MVGNGATGSQKGKVNQLFPSSGKRLRYDWVVNTVGRCRISAMKNHKSLNKELFNSEFTPLSINYNEQTTLPCMYV
ncbi:hypothetical protein CLV58_115100 [Spirosoma oryzae]|uniref:Uncharacterized protein n=1 Tax=Spirosoma oryzae TaxID=1469603 RepID=A0A2T0SNM4_9BACT|nr:hypothetical protein CLV58_115100 [Spirosoma oryzae]